MTATIHRLPGGDDVAWMSRGLCRDDPDLFFSDEPADIAKAQGICGDCPVQRQCADHLARFRRHWGVWAGVDTGARRRREQVAS